YQRCSSTDLSGARLCLYISCRNYHPSIHLAHFSFPTRRSSDLRWNQRNHGSVAHPPGQDSLCSGTPRGNRRVHGMWIRQVHRQRSEEHTSELQSLAYLVCRLLLEKKKIGETIGQAKTLNYTGRF